MLEYEVVLVRSPGWATRLALNKVIRGRIAYTLVRKYTTVETLESVIVHKMDVGCWRDEDKAFAPI